MSRKREEIFLLTAHYCRGLERKNTEIGMSSITATDGVPLFLSIREVVDNFFLKSKIVRITSDGGSNLQVCRNAMESKYTNGSIFTTQDPIHHGATCTHIGRGLQGGSAIDQFG